MNKLFKEFILEIARIVRFDQDIADNIQKTYISKNSKNDNKDVLLLYNKINNIAKKYNAKIDKTSFIGHLNDRIVERNISYDDIFKLFLKVSKQTSFFDDLSIQNKGYINHQRRKYGPQILYPSKNIHIGTEITKENGKYNIVVRSVMGKYSSGTIKKLKKWTPTPKLYFVK